MEGNLAIYLYEIYIYIHVLLKEEVSERVIPGWSMHYLEKWPTGVAYFYSWKTENLFYLNHYLTLLFIQKGF